MYDVVIPARNEQSTIKPIVETLRAHPLVNRIIVCVDWDTDDKTAMMARSPATLVLHDASMRGKGQCVNFGLKYVHTDRVLLCDADYRGMCINHIDRLLFGWSDTHMVIGIPDPPPIRDIPPQFIGKIEYAWAWMSGIRVVETAIIKPLRLTGYLMETQINHAYSQAKKRVKFIRLPNLVSPLVLDEKRLAEMGRDRKLGQEMGLLPE